MGYLVILLVASSLSFVGIHGQPDSLGFISIDCGYTTNSKYTDVRTGITYVSDEGFIDSGVTHTVNLENMQPDVAQRYSTVRFFPNGTRNCYTLQSLTPGGKYYVRTAFGYGNYDTLNMLPTFDLYLGVNYWTTVSIINSSTAYVFEMIAVSPANYLQVCLVNKGSGTPFISGLDLRSFQANLYPDCTTTQSPVLLSFFRDTVGFGPNRYHFGTDYHHIRYPDDLYDRMWQKYEDVPTWTIIPDAINGTVKNPPNDTYGAPSAVMRSASTPVNASRMDLWWSLDSSMSVDGNTKFLVALYFTELETLEQNEFRQFNVFLDNATLVSAFKPEQMLTSVVTGTVQGAGSHSISLVATSNSKPPLISALEIYLVRPLNGFATYSGDATAMMTIQTKYHVKRNWAGDPCYPVASAWDGLNCSYNTSGPSRIIAIYLSSSGLIGEIDSSFGQLTLIEHFSASVYSTLALLSQQPLLGIYTGYKYVTDLSHNNLSGSIPDFLGQMPSLTFLDLSSNNLSGSVPSSLLQKAQNGSVQLRVDNNPNLCVNGTCGPLPKGKKNLVIIIASVLGGGAFVAILVTLFIIKCRRTPKDDPDRQPVPRNKDTNPLGDVQGPQAVLDGRTSQSIPNVQPSQSLVAALGPEPLAVGQALQSVGHVPNGLATQSMGETSHPQSVPDSQASQDVPNGLASQSVGHALHPQSVPEGQGSQSAPDFQADGMTTTRAKGTRRFSFEELEVFTDKFKIKIGDGAFGPVFRGKLEDGTPVAVKRRRENSWQGDKEFLAEVTHLPNACHKCLVSLLGYCKDEVNLCLVYEYMPMGNLDQRLRATGEAPLTWLQRLKIALDSAHGLQYLHSGFSKTLIHRDVKTRNILLTEKLDAKIADFGLSRPLSSESITHTTTTPAGTLGYLDPEYSTTHRLSDKSDVYSFGIVLLVLITGQSATISADDGEGDEMGIADWVRSRFPEGEGTAAVIDQRMRGDGCDINSVQKVVELALRCAQREAAPRPRMAQVVATLMESLQLARASVARAAAGTSAGTAVATNETAVAAVHRPVLGEAHNSTTFYSA